MALACRLAAVAAIAAALTACGSAPPSRGGGYYLDDGPGYDPPPDIDRIPDAVPRLEPLHRGAARPYVVMGRRYTPMTSLQPYRARGIASWYGRRYHGKPTSSGEPYDMYAMTAAHPTLPIPSYARVTHLGNGRSVIVRINDRGPFIGGRLIDLSYTAAHRLGILERGSGPVEVEAILPGAEPAYAGTPPAEPPPAAPEPAPEPPVTAAAPVSTAGGAHYLQLAAFGSRANAESFLARVKAQAQWLAHRLQLHAGEGLYRVQAGPYESREDALASAERIVQSLGERPFVITR